jgi:putative tricarboxylic transport membrane protein
MVKRWETIVAAILGAASVVCVLLIDLLVAPSKMLLGRALTAIEPSLFPVIILVGLTALCAIFLWTNRGANSANADQKVHDIGEWSKVVMFFVILLIYALIFNPFGFLISTAIALALLSFLAGNRSVFQIATLSIASPIALYLVTTRLLLVSLPELSVIEFAYASIFNRG